MSRGDPERAPGLFRLDGEHCLARAGACHDAVDPGDRQRDRSSAERQPARQRPPETGGATTRATRHRGGADRLRDALIPLYAGKMSLRTMAWTPQLPSTTWVTPKSTAIDIRLMASSSVRPLAVIRKRRILRKASRMARSTDDFWKISLCAAAPRSAR